MVKGVSVQRFLNVGKGPGDEGYVDRHDLLMNLEGLGVFADL